MTALLDHATASADDTAVSAPTIDCDGNGLRPIDDRERDILTSFRAFVDADSDFQNQQQSDEARKTATRPPDRRWYAAAYALVMAVVAGPCPRRFIGGFLAAVEKLGVALSAHLIDNPRPFDVFPRPALTNARDSLRRELEAIIVAERPRARLETLPELLAQQVPHEQIARMLGPTWPDGRGKKHLIQQEIDNPGSVLPAGYVPTDPATEATIVASTSGFCLSVAAERLRAWKAQTGIVLE